MGCFIQLLDVCILICLTGYFKARCLIEILPCLWLKRMDLMPTDHAILVRTTWGWMNGSMSCRCIPASRSAGSRARAPSYPGGDGDYYVLTTCVPSSAPLVADAIGCVHTTVPAAPVNYEISLSRHTVDGDSSQLLPTSLIHEIHCIDFLKIILKCSAFYKCQCLGLVKFIKN